MAPEFPSNLIRDIQIRLRRAAGVPSYDPGDPSIPSVPSVGEAVAALDPSLPSYLRCKRCHGGLCRGINSFICIFCGAEQSMDGISHTISFTSTAGCRDFLQSLNLDGSEIVILETESKDLRSVQDSPKGGVALSNILDIELRWPRELEQIDNSSNNKAPHEAPISLSGFNLENFFSDQKNEVYSRPSTSDATSNLHQASAHDVKLSSGDFDTFFSGTRNETASNVHNTIDKQFMPKEQNMHTQVKLSSRSKNFGYFEDHQSVDVMNNSSDAKGGDLDDAFADWETDFQSASSAPFDAKSKRQNSADFQSANPAAVSVETKTIDLFQNPMDYQSANSETVSTDSRKMDPLQVSVNFQSDNTAAVAMESRTIDLLPNSVDFQATNSETGAIESRHIDLFQNSSDVLSNYETLATGSRQIGLLQNFATESYSYPMTKSMSDKGTNTVHSSSENGSSIRDLTHEGNLPAPSNDWFQNDLWSQFETKKSKEANELGSRTSTSNGEVKSAHKETTFDGVNLSQDDLWLVSSVDEISNIKREICHDDDLFDDWQDFTTSTNELRNFSSLQAQTSNRAIFHGHSSEAKSQDLDEMEFGSFKQSGSFVQSSSDFKTGEGDASIVQRTNQNKEKTVSASTIHRALDIGENIHDAHDTDTSKVDMLLARMPDLSFMLEETLSIPKKPSSSDLNA